MMHIRFTPLRVASGLLLSAALVACEATTPVEVPDLSRADDAALPAQSTPVEIHAVFSGPPNRDPNQISLDDPTVFVQILDIEEYLGRPASPSDVRIGESWEDGTPAEDFEILDLNSDGDRDIQLRFSTQALIDDGHLGPNTTELTVWGRDATSGEEYEGTAEVEIIGGDPPGELEDLVVVNDGNFFFDAALNFAGVDNERFVRNVVNFENAGPRSEGSVVWWDRGRNSRTTTTPVRAREVIEDEGYTVEVIRSDSTHSFLDIPAEVRSIWLWTPVVEFTNAEINGLKEFVREGGRILFIGENASFYGPVGLATMNNFFIRMGVSIRGVSGTSHGGFQTSTNIEPHPLMAGVQALRWAGGGVLEAGPEADPMFYDMTGALLVGVTEPIDPTPLTGRERFEAAPWVPIDPRAPASESGL